MLALPGTESEDVDHVVRLVLVPVGRVAASLRHGRWDDQSAMVEQLTLDQLDDAVKRFGAQEIYGWRFFDAAEAHNDWLDRLSLDWRSTPGGTRHGASLFQEWGLPGALQHLDIRLWFDELRIFNLAMNMVPLADFVAGGVR